MTKQCFDTIIFVRTKLKFDYQFFKRNNKTNVQSLDSNNDGEKKIIIIIKCSEIYTRAIKWIERHKFQKHFFSLKLVSCTWDVYTHTYILSSSLICSSIYHIINYYYYLHISCNTKLIYALIIFFFKQLTKYSVAKIYSSTACCIEYS